VTTAKKNIGNAVPTANGSLHGVEIPSRKGQYFRIVRPIQEHCQVTTVLLTLQQKINNGISCSLRSKMDHSIVSIGSKRDRSIINNGETCDPAFYQNSLTS